MLGLGALAGCVGYVALVFSTATWAEARALDAIFPYDGWHIQPFSAAAYWQLTLALSAAALVLVAAWLGLASTPGGRTQLAATAREVGAAARRLGAQWRVLPRRQRGLALGGLAALTLVRAYLSTGYRPYGDDAISYEFFVRHRLLAVAAYYPMPNNHILANTLSWGCYQLWPSFWASMRLPVLLTSTLGAGLLFGVLLRRVGFGSALLATGAFSWLQLGLFYASNGRGYWLVLLLAGVVFWGLLHLLDTAADAPPAGRAVAGPAGGRHFGVLYRAHVCLRAGGGLFVAGPASRAAGLAAAGAGGGRGRAGGPGGGRALRAGAAGIGCQGPG